MLILLLSLFSVPLVHALPTQHHRAPLKRANDIPRAVASVPNSYIVSLKPGSVDPNARGDWLDSVLSSNNSSTNRNGKQHAQSHAQHHNHVRNKDDQLVLSWDERIFNGLAGTFTSDQVDILQARDEVAYIQQDILLHTTAAITQTNAPWGLSRLSSINGPPLGSAVSTLNYTYVFDSSGGSGVDIFVLDTGIRTSHQDFGGRAIFLQTFGSGTPGEDVNGHGSHVSGTAAGSVFGVAKSATIQMIKCVDDSGAGSTADIISAINLAATNAASSGRASIVSMSIAGPANQAIDDAVTNSVNLGVPFVVAAGNEGRDASTDSPARLGGPGGNSGVITVGATTIADAVASFSNFGSNVDIFAPGQDILSVGVASDNAVQNLSGTSMSTPHVSGLAALVMGVEGKLSPAALKSRVVSLASSGVLGSIPSGTRNLLASTINGV